MADNSVVLVNGINGYMGAQVASQLSRQEQIDVIGLDDEEPTNEIENIQSLVTTLHDENLSSILKEESVDTVCHLKYSDNNGQEDTANIELTMNFISACAGAGVKNIILPSSTVVYGASRKNPAFFKEDATLTENRSFRYARSYLEVEDICRQFREQFPHVGLATLRFANIVGRNADSPMIRFLNQDRPAVLLGFDPIFQLIHEFDVVEALVQGVLRGWTGNYNVAAEGSMPLSRMLRLLRKIPVPVFHPLVYGKSAILGKRNSKLDRSQPLGWDYLRYSCVADIDKMRDELSFFPQYTAEETLREFSGIERPDSEEND